VRPGRPVDEPQVEPIRIVPQAPVAGSTKEQIAVGFIRAGAGFQEKTDGPNVAQDYLVPESAVQWRPTSSVTVIGADLTATELATGGVTIRSTAIATVSSEGRYVEHAPGSAVTATLGMSKVGGQWRASLPEDFGLWLTATDFERLFQPVRIVYGAKERSSLVADVRWFPKGSGLATSIARAEIAPVPDYLKGAVETGFPAGASLAVDAVTVQQGVATVQVTDSALSASESERRLMYAQLVASLLQAQRVSAVTVTVARTPLELADHDVPVASIETLGFSPPQNRPITVAYVRTGATLERVDALALGDTGPTREPTASPTEPQIALPEVPAGWIALAMAPDGSEIAAVGGDRREMRRWRGQQPISVTLDATGLTRPSYDDRGYLWVGGYTRRGAGVWVVDRAVDGSAPSVVSAPWLVGRRVVSLRVSPDGSRVAVVSQTLGGTGDRLDISGIVRNAAGVPTALDSPLRQADPLVLVRDVTWLDADTVAVLGRIGSRDPIRAYVAPIGQGVGLRDLATAPLVSPVPEGRSVTTVGGARRLVVTSDDGVVHVRSGSVWVALAKGSEVVVPGQ
jgi:hypothetical protein